MISALFKPFELHIPVLFAGNQCTDIPRSHVSVACISREQIPSPDDIYLKGLELQHNDPAIVEGFSLLSFPLRTIAAEAL